LERLSLEEDARQQLAQQKRKLEQELGSVRKDVENLEIAASKADGDKTTKDHQIRALNTEVQEQDQLIHKLNKEKKMLQEANQKSAEEIQVARNNWPNHQESMIIKASNYLLFSLRPRRIS